MKTTRSFPLTLWAVVWSAVLLTLSPAVALAQEFQRIEGPLRPELPAGPFVGTAYGFIWIAMLVYVLFVARGLSRVRADLEELRRKLQKKIDSPGPRP
jgi:heme exporter protein D